MVASQDRRIMERAGRTDLLDPLIKRCGRLLDIAPADRGDREPAPSLPPPPDTQMDFVFADRRAAEAGRS